MAIRWIGAIWLISARVSVAAHHLKHVRGRNPRGRPAQAQRHRFEVRPRRSLLLSLEPDYLLSVRKFNNAGYPLVTLRSTDHQVSVDSHAAVS